MKLLLLIFGIMIVSLAFDRSKRFGSMMLALVVLGLLLTAQRKGIIR